MYSKAQRTQIPVKKVLYFSKSNQYSRRVISLEELKQNRWRQNIYLSYSSQSRLLISNTAEKYEFVESNNNPEHLLFCLPLELCAWCSLRALLITVESGPSWIVNIL